MLFFSVYFHMVMQALLQIRVVFRHQRGFRQAIENDINKESQEAEHRADFKQARDGKPGGEAQAVGSFGSVLCPVMGMVV